MKSPSRKCEIARNSTISSHVKVIPQKIGVSVILKSQSDCEGIASLFEKLKKKNPSQSS